MNNNKEKKEKKHNPVKSESNKIKEKVYTGGDAGFGVDVGYVDRKNYIYD